MGLLPGISGCWPLIKSTSQDSISGVVFFDAGENAEKEIKVDFDMVPREADEETYTVAFEQPRGGLKTEIEEQEFSITVSQNVEIPVIDVIAVPEIARQRYWSIYNSKIS